MCPLSSAMSHKNIFGCVADPEEPLYPEGETREYITVFFVGDFTQPSQVSAAIGPIEEHLIKYGVTEYYLAELEGAWIAYAFSDTKIPPFDTAMGGRSGANLPDISSVSALFNPAELARTAAEGLAHQAQGEETSVSTISGKDHSMKGDNSIIISEIRGVISEIRGVTPSHVRIQPGV